MTSTQDKIWAASFLSRHLTSADDAELISSLLSIAASEEVARRSLSTRQYDLLEAHRVLSLVPSDWTVPAERDLRSDKRKLLIQQMKLVAEAGRVIQQLTDDGIDCRVLKGLATSELDYHDQSLRTFGDIDLLVLPSDFEAAVRSIERLGAVVPTTARLAYVFGKAATPVLGSGSEIDIHYRITKTAGPPETLFENPSELAACAGLAMGVELRLVHAASHLMFAPPGVRRLSGLADISALRARHNVDLEAVRQHAASMNCEALVGLAMQLERVLGGRPTDTDHWAQPSRLERASHARSNRRILAEHALYMSYLGSTSQKVQYLAHWAIPTRGAADKRGGFASYFRRMFPERFGGQTGGDAI